MRQEKRLTVKGQAGSGLADNHEPVRLGRVDSSPSLLLADCFQEPCQLVVRPATAVVNELPSSGSASPGSWCDGNSFFSGLDTRTFLFRTSTENSLTIPLPCGRCEGIIDQTGRPSRPSVPAGCRAGRGARLRRGARCLGSFGSSASSGPLGSAARRHGSGSDPSPPR